jgi:hypothetical protein
MHCRRLFLIINVFRSAYIIQADQFSTFWRSFLRLTVMMQGEFDYEDTVEISGKETEWIFWSGQTLFGLFGCILSLILIDIFLGYTVSDINVRRIGTCIVL